MRPTSYRMPTFVVVLLLIATSFNLEGNTLLKMARGDDDKGSLLTQGLGDLQSLWDKAKRIGVEQAFAADKTIVEQSLGNVYAAFNSLAREKRNLTQTIKSSGAPFDFGRIINEVNQLRNTVDCLMKNLNKMAPKADSLFDKARVSDELLAGLQQKAATLKEMASSLGLASTQTTSDSALLKKIEDDSETAAKKATDLRDLTKELAKTLDDKWTAPTDQDVCKMPDAA